MRTILALATLLAACDAAPGPLDAGHEPIPDAAVDAAMDASPEWRRLCGTALHRPVEGEDAYCPAVHEYVSRARYADGGVPDAEICRDAGPDAGEVCGRPTRGWAILNSCVGWVTCDLGGERRCYHCIEWSPSPRHL